MLNESIEKSIEMERKNKKEAHKFVKKIAIDK